MKALLTVFTVLLFMSSAFAQISYLQYRYVSAEHEEEFIEKETKYWAKVAKAAVDKGQMAGWALWRKIGVTQTDGPNYVFVNSFESPEKINMESVWSESNLAEMGVSPDMVETNSISKVTFDYWLQLEDVVRGDYKYAIVNYAMPDSRQEFINENKTLWKPYHEKNIKAGNNGWKSWGLMSVIYPTGKLARFSCITWDGFDTMADVMNYMRYQPMEGVDDSFQAVLDKSKMDEILPKGFEYSIVYELVMRIAPE